MPQQITSRQAKFRQQSQTGGCSLWYGSSQEFFHHALSWLQSFMVKGALKKYLEIR
jgi:hypothetical protein